MNLDKVPTGTHYLTCSGCLKKEKTAYRDMFDGLCADCTTKGLWDEEFAKRAKETNKVLKNNND